MAVAHHEELGGGSNRLPRLIMVGLQISKVEVRKPHFGEIFIRSSFDSSTLYRAAARRHLRRQLRRSRYLDDRSGSQTAIRRRQLLRSRYLMHRLSRLLSRSRHLRPSRATVAAAVLIPTGSIRRCLAYPRPDDDPGLASDHGSAASMVGQACIRGPPYRCDAVARFKPPAAPFSWPH